MDCQSGNFLHILTRYPASFPSSINIIEHPTHHRLQIRPEKFRKPPRRLQGQAVLHGQGPELGDMQLPISFLTD